MEIKFIDNLFRNIRIREALKHILPLDSHLDIGCGNGYCLKLSPCKYKIGIDKETTGERAEDKLKEFSNNQFDYITIIATLEHLDDPELVLKESCRILKPNGTLIITMNRKWIDPFLRLFSNKQKEHKRYLSRKEISEIIAPTHKIVKYYTFELGLNQVFIIRSTK